MTGKALSIDCPNCGAGQTVLGGGRVTTQVCGYCGAALDATDAFRVLEVFAGMERPASPFRLGAESTIRGVRWTVIGTLGLLEREDGREWRWTDHMLHSPTHGYAWLTVEDGHLLFTRKVRDWPDGTFLDRQALKRALARPERDWRGRTFRYYAASDARVDFAEGAFNFRPRRGDYTFAASLMAMTEPPEMLTYVSGGRENEVELTRYAPEAAAAFGVPAPRPEGRHPLQTEEAVPDAPFLGRWFLGLAVVSLLALFALPEQVGTGRTNALWLFLATAVFGFAGLWLRRSGQRRWAGSDWNG